MADGEIVSLRPRGQGSEAPRARWGNTITKREIDWLWKPFLQRRAINLLTGDPGVGKSTIVCELVAALSVGRPLPGDPPGLHREPVNSWIMQAEDAADDTIVWRLENQGADLRRVLITDVRETITARVAKEIGDQCRDEGIALLSIDPMQAWVGKDMDMNRANETRDWGSNLRGVAMENNLAVLLCRHKRKGAPGESSMMAGLGSIDITGIARSEITATRDKTGQRYIQRIKGTVGITGQGLPYTTVPHPDNDHGVFKWEGVPRDMQPPGATEAGVSRTPKAKKLAEEWLALRLSQGPVNSLTLLTEAAARGISERTLRRAKSDLNITAKQVAPNDWVWSNG
jgi:hypothetical protein